MRSRDRLIDVLLTVNASAIGMSATAFLMAAADHLRDREPFPLRTERALTRISAYHSSPHIRELAHEALILQPQQEER